MVSAPFWTENEFEIVINSYGMRIDDLCGKLSRRSQDDIESVIVGIHAYHQCRDSDTLCTVMKEYIDGKCGKLECPKCGNKF